MRLRSGLDAFALLLPDTQNGYYPSLLAGFEAAAGGLRSQVLVIDTRNDSHRQADGILQLIDKKVGGRGNRARDVAVDARLIRCANRSNMRSRSCCVTAASKACTAPLLAFNGRDVGRLAGEAMLRKGHRQVAFISTWRTDLAGRYEAGLRAALEGAGAALPEDRVVYLEVDAYTDLVEYEKRMKQAIGALDQAPPPTAIFNLR